MPIGITEGQVVAAIRKLEQEQRQVTLKSLRAELGRGSNTTLLRHLRRLAPKLDERRRTPPPSRALGAELDALMRRVWSVACVDAARSERTAFATRAAAIEAQRVRLAGEVRTLRTEAGRLLRRLDRTESELRRLARRLGDVPPSHEAATRPHEELPAHD